MAQCRDGWTHSRRFLSAAEKRIGAVVIRGDGKASKGSYTVVISLAAKELPALSGFGSDGTINLRLDEDIDKSRADHWSSRLSWEPDRAEIFGFTKIKIEFPYGGKLYDAWIVIPEGTRPTYDNCNEVEVIASELVGGKPALQGIRCALHFDHNPTATAPTDFGKLFGKSLTRKC